MLRSGNPVFRQDMLEQSYDNSYASPGTMTIRGTATKTLILLGLCTGTACFTWSMVWSAVAGEAPISTVMPWLWGGAIGGLILGFVTSFMPRWASVTAPLYAIAEGLFLGGLSALLEVRYPGIALQGVSATFGTLCTLMLAYQSGVIRATDKFKAGVVAATGGICLIYMVGWVLSFFGMSIPYINEPNWFGIGFSVVVVIIAALNLILDFDYIESASAAGAPKSMEWYGAFGLMVTLVWLYIEILRLLAKINSSRD
ncbi:hypothetical protein GC163_10280 [bacterium]|nr:hypothetical protein [bacterium]